MTRCSSAACSVSLVYRGGPIAIIGERGPRGGIARVIVDGRAKTIRLDARRSRSRQVLCRFRARARRRHSLMIRVVSGVVALEGYAITR